MPKKWKQEVLAVIVMLFKPCLFQQLTTIYQSILCTSDAYEAEAISNTAKHL